MDAIIVPVVAGVRCQLRYKAVKDRSPRAGDWVEVSFHRPTPPQLVKTYRSLPTAKADCQEAVDAVLGTKAQNQQRRANGGPPHQPAQEVPIETKGNRNK